MEHKDEGKCKHVQRRSHRDIKQAKHTKKEERKKKTQVNMANAKRLNKNTVSSQQK